MTSWRELTYALNASVVAAFGKEVVYLPEAGEAVTVRAVVETVRQPEETSPGVYATLFLRLADLPKPPDRGDQISIDNILYKVFDIDADEGGGVVLRLRQV